MSNLNVTSGSNSIAVGGTTANINGGAWGGGYPFMQTWCQTCNQYYQIGSSHTCPINNQTLCSSCGQYWNGQFHVCTSTGIGTSVIGYPGHTHVPGTWTGTWSTGTSTFTTSPVLKNVKEVTTDISLEYVMESFVTANLKLPLKFSDCFLKVGATYSSLYPLIISANEGDSTELSFYIVTSVINRIFEGDLVVLQNITLSKIDDNLTLLQLSERTKNYFKKDEDDAAN